MMGNKNKFYLMFVSDHFTGNFISHIERISQNKGINGTALAVTNLLLCAEAYKSGNLNHKLIRNELFNNGEFLFN